MNVTMNVCTSCEPLGLLACHCSKLSSQCVYEMIVNENAQTICYHFEC